MAYQTFAGFGSITITQVANGFLVALPVQVETPERMMQGIISEALNTKDSELRRIELEQGFPRLMKLSDLKDTNLHTFSTFKEVLDFLATVMDSE